VPRHATYGYFAGTGRARCVVLLRLGDAWSSDAEQSLSYTRDTRTKRATTSSSELVELPSPSAVVSDIPPGECVSSGAMCEASRGARVDDSTSAFLCSFKRGLGDAYGWNRNVDIILVPVEPVLF